MKEKEYKADLCVIGGGMAGLCAAIAAARHGIKVVLMQDRAVLGGNASSEIRMWICGAHGEDMRETGIIEELLLENFYLNTGLKFSIWDTVLYGKAIAEKNLTLLLNCSCQSAKSENNHIKSVTGWQSCAQTYHKVYASYFADCSGDSVLAPLCGAAYMYGREAKSDFNESIPPEIADRKTMGMSIIMQTRETTSPKKFIPPNWAYKYETDADLPYKDHRVDNNFWWIEVGGEWDCVHDTDRCRDECLKIAYGVWDHMKNKGDHGAENWELEWIGMLPGKRESRRYIGKHIITQNDVESGGHFKDVIAYGGWSMDDHFPAGFYYKESYPTIFHPAPSPWGIPFSSLVARDIDNLLFAGRNISVTHAALSSSRVMATCAVLGQAVGTAVALAISDKTDIKKLDIDKLQQALLWDDCFIPYVKRRTNFGENASLSAEIVGNGNGRGEENMWRGKEGDTIDYTFKKPQKIKQIRLVFDSDLNREYHNMPCCYPLKEEKFRLPETLISDFEIRIERSDKSEAVFEFKNNRSRLVLFDLNETVRKLSFVPKATHGCKEYRVFEFDFK